MNIKKELAQTAKDLGFTVALTRGGHVKYSGYGQIIYASSTTSDVYALRKVTRQLQNIKEGKCPSKIERRKAHA